MTLGLRCLLFGAESGFGGIVVVLSDSDEFDLLGGGGADNAVYVDTGYMDRVGREVSDGDNFLCLGRGSCLAVARERRCGFYLDDG